MNRHVGFTPSFYIILRVVIVLILFSLPIGCAVKSGPVLMKDGREYGRTEGVWGGNFWDFYQRGSSYASGAFWPLALADFHQAIRLKNQDQRRVRTYGLHILDDYFPHRELGIAFYEMGDLQKAIQELSFSLSCYPSAKTKYYLNRAREANLRQTRQDITPPKIWITSHHDQQFVSGFEAIIEGKAQDDWFVEKITINGFPYSCELAQPDIAFKTICSLHQGLNEIRIIAKDLVGHDTEESLRLIADRQAPILYIEDLFFTRVANSPNASEEIQIEGRVDDLCGIKIFQIDKQTVPFLDNEGKFLFRYALPKYSNSLLFVAEDLLGNRVKGQIRIPDYLPEKAGLNRQFQVASLNLAGLSHADIHPPAIVLESPSSDKLVVDWKTLFISGEVHDLKGIQDLLVNEESILSQEGKKIYFNYTLKLQPGENIIIIKAIDLSGNERVKTLEIERTINPVYRVGSRMSVAIIPFKYRGEELDNQQFVADHLIHAFVEQERFRVVDRERIDRIVQRFEGENPDEPHFSPLEIGKLVSAESVLAGSIYENNGFIEVVARLIDTETSVIIDTQDVYGFENPTNLKSLLEGLGLKFKHSFPLVEGVIIEKEGQNILVNLGKEKNIKEFTKYIVFRPGESIKDPKSRQLLEQKPHILGEAKILKVFEQISEANLFQPKEDIRIKDHVITK